MMIVYIHFFENVFQLNFIFNHISLSFHSIANIRSILGIANVNENAEVKADRYPQYEVDENFLL